MEALRPGSPQLGTSKKNLKEKRGYNDGTVDV